MLRPSSLFPKLRQNRMISFSILRGNSPIPDLSALNGEKEPDGGMSDKERDAERGRKRERKKKKKRFSMGRSAEYMADSDSDLLFSEPHMPFSFKESFKRHEFC